MTYHGDSHVQVVKMFGNSGSKNYPTCWLMKCNHWSSFIPWSTAIPRRFDRLARTDISMMWCKLCIATSSRTISCCAGVHSLSHQVHSFKQFQFHNLFASRICFCFSIFPIGKCHLNKFRKDKTFRHFWRLSCEVLPNHPSWVECRPGWDGLAVKLCDFGTARCK